MTAGSASIAALSGDLGDPTAARSVFFREQAQVLSNRNLAAGLLELRLESPRIASAAAPGQFVNVLVAEGWDPLLRRPMSIAGIADGAITLIYKVIGRGTAAMSTWQAGDSADLLGPLGRGWDVSAGGLCVLLGGGVGIAPILYLRQQLASDGRSHHLIMGAGTGREHFLGHDPDGGITLTSDDGSVGVGGNILDGLAHFRQSLDLSGGLINLFGCGPIAMLDGLKRLAVSDGIPCQLALEETMACGFGFCQGCSVLMRPPSEPPAHSYRSVYKLACLDGPVFRAEELL